MQVVFGVLMIASLAFGAYWPGRLWNSLRELRGTDLDQMKHQFTVLFAVHDVNKDGRWTKDDIDFLKSGAKLYIPESDQAAFSSMQDDFWMTLVKSESLYTEVDKEDFMAAMSNLYVNDKQELIRYVRTISGKVMESFVDINRDGRVSKVELDNAAVDFHTDVKLIDRLLPITVTDLVRVLVKLYTVPGEDAQGRIVDKAVKGGRLI